MTGRAGLASATLQARNEERQLRLALQAKAKAEQAALERGIEETIAL